MAREKFQTLTEQMFYILMCLCIECYGMDIMEKIRIMTNGRVLVGPGTLYNLLESFVKAEMIRETKVEGRRRSYIITDLGRQALLSEYERIAILTMDYKKYMLGGGNDIDEKN